jgi:hypothetical protein
VMYLNRQESAKGVHVPPERYFVIKPIILWMDWKIFVEKKHVYADIFS